MVLRSTLWMLVLFAAMVPAAASDFYQFRGPNGCGVTGKQPIPESWSSDENIAWQVSIPGFGWSQPVVCGGRVYVTSAVAEEELRPKNSTDGVKSPQSMGITLFAKPPDVPIEWQVFCLDAATGKQLWRKTVFTGKARYAIHPSNTYATESPVADADGVYVYFGACGKVAGFTRDGELAWTKDVGVYKTSNKFGTGSSLAIHRGKIYLQNFTEGSAEIRCFQAKSGDQLWKKQREKNETAWSTPIIWETEERCELIVSAGSQVESLDPDSGEQFWTVRNVKAATACSPCADKKRLYFGGSDPFSKGPLYAISAGATGDISPESRGEEFAQCAWQQDRAGPGMPSPVSSGQYVYVVDSSVLRCYKAETGERVYQNRLPRMRMVAASPLIIGDKLLVIDEYGTACLIMTGPKFEVVGGGSVNDVFWATPAVADRSLFLRGVEKLYCIRASESQR
jgi:outer membrane protein assembly factor BamB